MSKTKFDKDSIEFIELEEELEERLTSEQKECEVSNPELAINHKYIAILSNDIIKIYNKDNGKLEHNPISDIVPFDLDSTKIISDLEDVVHVWNVGDNNMLYRLIDGELHIVETLHLGDIMHLNI
ncbi:MAG: hypothetical protein AB8B67_03550 [Rickettsiaceae bacterium]